MQRNLMFWINEVPASAVSLIFHKIAFAVQTLYACIIRFANSNPGTCQGIVIWFCRGRNSGKAAWQHKRAQDCDKSEFHCISS